MEHPIRSLFPNAVSVKRVIRVWQRWDCTHRTLPLAAFTMVVPAQMELISKPYSIPLREGTIHSLLVFTSPIMMICLDDASPLPLVILLFALAALVTNWVGFGVTVRCGTTLLRLFSLPIRLLDRTSPLTDRQSFLRVVIIRAVPMLLGWTVRSCSFPMQLIAVRGSRFQYGSVCPLTERSVRWVPSTAENRKEYDI